MVIGHKNKVRNRHLWFNITSIRPSSRLWLIILLCAIPLYFFCKSGYNVAAIILFSVILMQTFLFKKLQDYPFILLITIYSFSYFIYLIPYFFEGKQLSFWSEYQNFEWFSLAGLQFYVFYASICFASSTMKKSKRHSLIDSIKFNDSVYCCLFFVCITYIIITYLYLFVGQNVLSSPTPYLAYKENLGASNVLGLLVIMFIYFSGLSLRHRKYGRLVLLTMILLMFYYAATRGFRVTIAPLGVLFLIFFCEKKLTAKAILLISIGGLLLLGFLNALKMNEEFSIQYVFSSSDDFILSHQADQLYGSAVSTGLVETGKISFFERIILQIGLIGQSIIPPSFFDDSMRFPRVLNLYTSTGGGGLFPTGMTMIFGYIGMSVFTIMLYKFLENGYNAKNQYWKIAVLSIIIYFPNWFSYDLNVLFRFTIISLLIYYLSRTLKLCRDE